jgi:hypothetical protein
MKLGIAYTVHTVKHVLNGGGVTNNPGLFTPPKAATIASNHCQLKFFIHAKLHSYRNLICIRFYAATSKPIVEVAGKLRQRQQQQQQLCEDRMEQLLGDIFRGHEMVPDILDRPPPHALDMAFR